MGLTVVAFRVSHIMCSGLSNRIIAVERHTLFGREEEGGVAGGGRAMKSELLVHGKNVFVSLIRAG
jgi:hypothetical protein